MSASQIVEKIRERFPRAEEIKRADNLPAETLSVRVAAAEILDVCRFLRFELKFDYLSFLTAVDWKGPVGVESFTHDDPWALAGVTVSEEGAGAEGPMPASARSKPAEGLYRNVFELVYHLFSYETGAALFLKTEISRENPQMDSVATLWPTANWHERETYDFFGIKFLGHPDLRRILLPWEWDKEEGKWPLRKDYIHKRDPYD